MAQNGAMTCNFERSATSEVGFDCGFSGWRTLEFGCLHRELAMSIPGGPSRLLHDGHNIHALLRTSVLIAMATDDNKDVEKKILEAQRRPCAFAQAGWFLGLY